jgi:hypothetical protein
MAHFTCEHGSTYFPFGKGGRENLLIGCKSLQGPANTPNSAFLRLQECPLFSLPIIPPTFAKRVGDPLSNGAKITRPPTGSDIESEDSESCISLIPITIAAPTSDVALQYNQLAHDVVVELFKTQISAMMVRDK